MILNYIRGPSLSVAQDTLLYISCAFSPTPQRHKILILLLKWFLTSVFVSVLTVLSELRASSFLVYTLH